MKFCYQVATPDVAVSPAVTAFQGPLRDSLGTLAAIGYSGVELMTIDPSRLDWREIRDTAREFGLAIPLVCTGEVFGQLGVSLVDQEAASREKAMSTLKALVDFAGFLGADINVGRARGQYRQGTPDEEIYRASVASLRELGRYAAARNVRVALEPVTIMQTNFLNTVGEAAALADDVGLENVGVMMDVFHMNIEEKDLIQAIRDYAGRSIHVHLADNNRRYPGHCGMSFEAVIGAFHSGGYDGAFCTEIFQLPDQLTAAKGAMAHLRPIFESIYGRA